jgi:hypothetical protein
MFEPTKEMKMVPKQITKLYMHVYFVEKKGVK